MTHDLNDIDVLTEYDESGRHADGVFFAYVHMVTRYGWDPACSMFPTVFDTDDDAVLTRAQEWAAKWLAGEEERSDDGAFLVNDGYHYIGFVDWSDRAAFALIIEAARALCSVNRDVARRLLLDAAEHIARWDEAT